MDNDGDDSAGAGTGFAATITENGAAVAVADTDSLITDVDDTNMETGTIVLTNKMAGDQLLVNGSAAASGTFSGISYTLTVNAGDITIAMTSSATKANYEAFVEAVAFNNTSENPDTTARVINVTVNDGDAGSNIAASTISVVAVNDALSALMILLQPQKTRPSPTLMCWSMTPMWMVTR